MDVELDVANGLTDETVGERSSVVATEIDGKELDFADCKADDAAELKEASVVASKIEEESVNVADGLADVSADENASVAAFTVKVKGQEFPDGPIDMTASERVPFEAVSDALAEASVLTAAKSADVSRTRVVLLDTTDEVSEAPKVAIVVLAYGGLTAEVVAIECADEFCTALGCTFTFSNLIISAAYNRAIRSMYRNERGINRPSPPLHTLLLADVQPGSRGIYQRQQLLGFVYPKLRGLSQRLHPVPRAALRTCH